MHSKPQPNYRANLFAALRKWASPSKFISGFSEICQSTLINLNSDSLIWIQGDHSTSDLVVILVVILMDTLTIFGHHGIHPRMFFIRLCLRFHPNPQRS